MEHWITEVMDKFGYMGIFLLIAIENLFPPIPSEVILTFGGFMTTYTGLTVPGVILASTVGSLFGAVLLYLIGSLLDIQRLEKIVKRWGHILRLTPEDLHKANDWFAKYGMWTVFFCRFVPLIRSLISIPAGMAKMNFGIFLLLTAVGSLIWNAVLIFIGSRVGASWETIVEYMDIYSNFVYAGIAIAAIAVIVWWIRRRMLKRK
ncbi:alkaline phosphatase [Paenibacillus sp. 32O-W]|jgi:membrane protein DedA with SNARE-associated domain|uniref:DedA family protein n=1 Tax=Paenibacillus sp. 32O-W TaxID=1695218 RepID=UPI0007228501|nr:DedA family protein [Paenibacillus sp. 32O-W]ALS25889.1 alkaline phosphatase [Paenibacillus sp. 32O-W]